MSTVRDAAFDLFRRHGMTTIFGNPGSTELPMLADFPEDAHVRIPMQPAVRSLNLSNAVAITVYEAWRQTGFAGAC